MTKIIGKIRELSRFLQVWPVYVYVWQYDSKGADWDYAQRFPTYYHAWKYLAGMDEGGKESVRYNFMTKREYEVFEISRTQMKEVEK